MEPGRAAVGPDRSTTASGRLPGYCLQAPGELPSVKSNSGTTAIMLFWPSVKTHRIVPLAAATAVGVEMAKFDWRTRARVMAACATIARTFPTTRCRSNAAPQKPRPLEGREPA
jgi:hypothetical protein